MHANKEVEKKIKKVKLFNELLLIGGSNKLIFKAPDDDEKHYTLRVSKEGILDVHETIEGKEKFDEKYPVQERKKFDLEKLYEVIKKTLIEELPDILKEIDISDPKYMDAQVVVIPKDEVLWERLKKASQIKRKEMKIGESGFEDAMKDFVVPMKDLQNYDFKLAFVLEQDEISGSLYRVEGKYFLVQMNDWEVLSEKINEKSKTCALTENSL